MHECCCIDYVDKPAVINVKMVRARVNHTCCECCDTIVPGDKYERAKGLWNGGWSEYKTCRTCAAIRRDMFTCGFVYGALDEDLMECHGIELKQRVESEGECGSARR